MPTLSCNDPANTYAHTLFTPAAMQFLRHLHRRFSEPRQEILAARTINTAALRQGKKLDFLAETAEIRQSAWQVAEAPSALCDRRVEITGPVDRKMMVNALNSGAKIFMADLEDAQSPLWSLMLEGHLNLQKAARGTLGFVSSEGKSYEVVPQPATIIVRPRGWHLLEENACFDSQAMSGSLFDFGLHFFHNAALLHSQGRGPFYYLPKIESHREARLWNEVFNEAEDYIGMARGTVRATMLIETITAAFEMDEILFELRSHASGLNAGRWDYLFSIIKRLGHSSRHLLPDRAQLTMEVPFMRAYTNLLVQTCHKRHAHAMGGMAAYIPDRRNPEANERALGAVRLDKEREARDGFDGTWVAHPDLVPVALSVFDRVLGPSPHQKHIRRAEVSVRPEDLTTTDIAEGKISEAGVRSNISIALQYMEKWLGGVGAVAINQLMEDAATAEISRTQLWQWLHHHVQLSNGLHFTAELYQQWRSEEVAKLPLPHYPRLAVAVALLDSLVLAPEEQEFLTIPAYQKLHRHQAH